MSWIGLITRIINLYLLGNFWSLLSELLSDSMILLLRVSGIQISIVTSSHNSKTEGRMLNRFGKDVETIDSSLAGSLQAVNSSLASFFAAIITVALV